MGCQDWLPLTIHELLNLIDVRINNAFEVELSGPWKTGIL